MDAYFGGLLGEASGDDDDAQAEAAVAAAYTAGDDTEVLRLVEQSTARTFCFACVSAEMLAHLCDAILASGSRSAGCSVLTLGCGRGLLEWLLSRELARKSGEPPVRVVSCELADVAVDFFPEQSVHRVSETASDVAADALTSAAQDASVLLCVWRETGMLPMYLSSFGGDVVITIGEEGFTDPEPRQPIDGWRVASAVDFASGDACTVYRRIS